MSDMHMEFADNSRYLRILLLLNHCILCPVLSFMEHPKVSFMI